MAEGNFQMRETAPTQAEPDRWINTIAILEFAYPAVLLGILGALGLFFLYRRVDQSWPESYTSVQNVAAAQIRRGFLQHYVVFRGGPVFLIVLFLSVTAERLGSAPWLTAALTVLIHVASTNIRALIQVLGETGRPQRVTIAAHHIGVVAVSVASAVCAVLLRDALSGLIPRPEDVMVAVWAGLFAAIFGTAARWLMQPRPEDSMALVQGLKKDIGAANWEHICRVANERDCDVNVLYAVVLAEVQQRPKWTRMLERIKGLVVRQGSYGVAQVCSDRPISDEESIEVLARRFEGYFPSRDEYGSVDEESFERFLLKYNPDREHAQRIVEFYQQLMYTDFTD